MGNPKVHRNDLQIVKGKIEVDCVIIDNKPINLTPVPAYSIDNYCTHDDCISCGKEFKKRFLYIKICDECQYKKDVDKYYSYDLVEWDGETAVVLYDGDKYFFNQEDIEIYCEENELNPEKLMLVLCSTSNLSQIDLDHWRDDVHDDWEPSDEMLKRLKDFNDFLSKEPSNTWFPTKKRIQLKIDVSNG